jgi:Regulator of RNA terminal phosphate cyclase
MTKPKNILFSFVGTNDAGKLKGSNDGAILTALTNQKFDEVTLLWNKSGNKEIDYLGIANYLNNEIKKRQLAKKTTIVELTIKDVTDHNQIYLALKNFTDGIEKKENAQYFAAISSGTPAMQVCWILFSESGDFSDSVRLNLIKVKDPKFGKSENIPVKIDTALPQIIRLKEEVNNLKKDLIPNAVITISRPGLKIGETEIILSPIELTYYKYFVERVLEGKSDEKFSGFNTSNAFLDRVIEIHQELFPDLETSRMDLINIRKKDMGLSIYTFRGNISKLNKKIRNSLQNESITNNFEIYSEGGRGAKFYGIKAPEEKFLVLK